MHECILIVGSGFALAESNQFSRPFVRKMFPDHDIQFSIPFVRRIPGPVHETLPLSNFSAKDIDAIGKTPDATRCAEDKTFRPETNVPLRSFRSKFFKEQRPVDFSVDSVVLHVQSGRQKQVSVDVMFRIPSIFITQHEPALHCKRVAVIARRHAMLYRLECFVCSCLDLFVFRNTIRVVVFFKSSESFRQIRH